MQHTISYISYREGLPKPPDPQPDPPDPPEPPIIISPNLNCDTLTTIGPEDDDPHE